MEPPSVPPEVSGLASVPSPHQPPPPSGPSGPCQAALQFQGVFLSPQRGAVTVLAQQAGSFGAGTGRGEGHQGLVPRSQVTFSGCPLPGPWRAERMRHEGDNSSNSGHSKPRCQLSRQHWSGSSLIPTNPQESGSSYGMMMRLRETRSPAKATQPVRGQLGKDPRSCALIEQVREGGKRGRKAGGREETPSSGGSANWP